MTRRTLTLGGALATAMLLATFGFAQKTHEPMQNVSGKLHPNISAAQHHAEEAYNKIVAAQQANEYDMDGHAQKAKELLDQANRELKMAAESANKNKMK